MAAIQQGLEHLILTYICVVLFCVGEMIAQWYTEEKGYPEWIALLPLIFVVGGIGQWWVRF